MTSLQEVYLKKSSLKLFEITEWGLQKYRKKAISTEVNEARQN